MTALALGGCGVSSLVPDVERDRDFEGRVYAGAGALVSQLEPDADDVAGLELDQDTDAGGTVAIGYDISNRFALEGSYSALGEATFEPEGSVDYQVYSLSGLVYGLNSSDARARREGFSAFGRLGVGGMQNDATVEYERVDDVHLVAGLGVEYGFANGIGVRGEVVSHDTDARYAQLALLYRFGDTQPPRSSTRRSSDETARQDSSAGAPAIPVTPVPAERPSATRDASAGDTDRDGVADALDACPDTLGGRPVDATGCSSFDGTVEGIAFRSASDELTPEARGVLDGVAATLLDFPAVDVAIEAHTDNSGDAESNLQLSRRRAVAVARYLVSRGVEAERLRPRAFGESRPRVSNATPEGRAANRRVDFSTIE